MTQTSSPAAQPVLALDLGASRIRAAVVGGDGAIVKRADGRTPREAGPGGVIAAMVSMLRQVRDAAPDDIRRALAGVGIAAPGPLDAKTGTLVEPPNLGSAFHNVQIAEPIARATSLPVALERDTNVAALAEWEFGVARGATDFLYLTVSTGVGGAIVSDGRLVVGPDGAAGELGHVLVELDGPACGCGGRGHLEAISSGVGIARAAVEAIAEGSAPGLQRLAGSLGRGLDARDVAVAEQAGDPAAVRIMARARDAFAETCVALVNTFNPELVVVGGSIARSEGDRWLEPARRSVAAHAFRIPRERARIVPASLGDDVGLVGALPLLRRTFGD